MEKLRLQNNKSQPADTALRLGLSSAAINTQTALWNPLSWLYSGPTHTAPAAYTTISHE